MPPTTPAGAAPQPATGGWHLAEWTAELVGTALLLLFGTTWVVMDFAPGSPVVHAVSSTSLRLLLTGLLFPATGSLYSLTPMGRRSGAHLNPAVTFAFWLQRHLHGHDLAGYVGAQVAGATVGAGLARLLWGHADAQVPVSYAITHPGRGLSAVQAAAVEAAMTALLVGVIFAAVSGRRTARMTPLVVWGVITVLVWRVAPYTGTSLNPARTFGPDLVAGRFPALWAYVVGPLAGAGAVTAGWLLVRGRTTLTAKLFHDPRYQSVLRSRLPAMPATR